MRSEGCRGLPGLRGPVLLALMLAIGPVGPGAHAGERAECIHAAVAESTGARTAFERDVAALAVEADPALAEVAALRRDLRIATEEDTLARVDFLAETRPRALEREAGHVDWSDADAAGYMDWPGARDRAARVERLIAALDAHPGRPALEALVEGVLPQTLEHQAAATRLARAMRAARSALIACWN